MRAHRGPAENPRRGSGPAPVPADRGSVSLWVVIFTFTTLALLILVVDGGHIVAQGRHDDLLQSSLLYRRMCARLSVGKSLDEPETVDELMEAAKR